MFDEDGHWKEFGSLSKDHTMFPFWLFCITWAVVSYCITLFMMGSGSSSSSSTKVKVEPDEPTTTHPRSKKSKKATTSSSEDNDSNLVEPLSPSIKKSGKKPMKPGYYVLNKEATAETGAPKYVYYGSEPPEFMGEE